MKKIIIGLVGEMSSGKGAISKYIKEEHNGETFRFSDTFRKILNILNLECNRENMSNLSLTLRKTFGEDVLAKSIAKDVKNSTAKIIAVDGVRRLEDIKYLKEIPGFKLAFVEASIEKRYERIIDRGENADDNTKTLEDFKKDHKRNTEAGIESLRSDADITIDNNNSMEELFKRVDELVK
jgi:dephospho-CoA kinase